MTQAPAPDETLQARVRSAAAALLGIAVALLVAVLPGSAAPGARAQAGFSAASADQCLPMASDRVGEGRRALFTPKGPNARRPDFDGALAPASGCATLSGVAWADPSLRPAPARGILPGRWPSTTRARAPPLA